MGRPGDTATLDERSSQAAEADREAASSTAPTVPPADGRVALLEIGACLGRYTIRARIGRGGMGEVFAAHDPELDRLVAVKVMHAGAAAHSPVARLRLQREAQAMARLNHPNVVAVYDAGAIGGRTFVAMELVEGPTLAAWLREPRDARRVVDAFLQAGRGLAAAHAAGITHRDFKPSNVILGDRVRVVDFGLARPADDDEPAEIAPTALSATVTHSGAVLGTPAYMAPEQRAGAPCNARSDQYSFAVALREAVTGAHPGEPPRADARPIPPWLRPVLERALAPDPARRFASMEVLLAGLERSRHRTRRRYLAAAAVVALGAGVAGVAWTRGASDPCPGAEARMAGVWDLPRHAQVHAAFEATQLPYAQRTWNQVSAGLDRYREAWVDAHVQSCRATRVEGRQSAALLDLQMACLDRRRSMLHELTQLWIDGTDRTSLAAAGDAVAGLPAVAECTQGKALLDRVALPSDPAVVARIAEVRTGLDKVRALSTSGRIDDAHTRMVPVLAAADATGWLQVRAEAHTLAGRVAHALALPEAEQQLIEGNKLASDAHDDKLAAEALLDLVDHLALDEQSAQRALTVADLADAAVVRAGNDPRQRSRLLMFRGDAYYTANRFADAKEAFTRSRAVAAEAFGPGSFEVMRSLTKLSGVASSAGDNDESRRLGEEALAGMTALVGTDHPATAAILHELAVAMYNQDNFDAAADYAGRTLAIVERISGPDSVPAATVLAIAGEIETHRGHLDVAQRDLERALAIRERIQGPDHPDVARILQAFTSVVLLRGDHDRAIALSRRGLAISTRAYGPDVSGNAVYLIGIADGLLGKGEVNEALSYRERALALRQQALGPTNPFTLEAMVLVAEALKILHRCREAEPLLAAAIPAFEQAGADPSAGLEVRGECELAAGQAARALESARRSIEACEKTSPTSPECPSKYWLEARALDKLGRRREAVAAAAEAEQRASKAEYTLRIDRKQIRAWLAARR